MTFCVGGRQPLTASEAAEKPINSINVRRDIA
jgi:hypothetical protein